MILGVTPARGGSKGVPRKNVRPIHGRPLIAWTIEAAKAARLIERYIVSTEDPEIAAIARSHDVEVLDRPAELADDAAMTVDVLRHVLTQVDADTVVLLQATSPIRDAGLIDRCIRRFFETETDSLATGFMCKFAPYGKNTLRRQDLDGFFYDDGNVYVIRADVIRAGDRYGTRLEQVLLDREQSV